MHAANGSFFTNRECIAYAASKADEKWEPLSSHVNQYNDRNHCLTIPIIDLVLFVTIHAIKNIISYAHADVAYYI